MNIRLQTDRRSRKAYYGADGGGIRGQLTGLSRREKGASK
jgi:hypothetical protein